MSRIAIIGAGPAGLVSAKECLEVGHDVTVFEKFGRIGGLWNAGQGVWPDMRANLSKESCAFPDFEWPDDAPLFPSQGDILNYLKSYVEHFDLNNRADMRFNASAEARQEDGAWHVSSNGNSEAFDKIIIGSGFFSKPYIPALKGQEEYQGQQTHSARIKPFDDYAGRHVAVIGNAFSGCDIAVGLAKAGARVTHVFRRPVWIVPRLIGGAEPIDSAFYRKTEKQEGLTLSERYRATNEAMGDLCQLQNSMHEALYIDPNNNDNPPLVSVSDGYLEAVQAGVIDLKSMSHVEMTPKGIRGVSGDIDDVIYATGFETDLSLLDQTSLNAIDYEGRDRFLPALLHDGMWAKDMPNAAFVGMYRGPFFLTMALQAKWAAQAFRDEALMPTMDDIEAGVVEMRELRALPESQRPQFPIDDYVGYVERLAGHAGVAVQYEEDQRVLVSDYSGQKRAIS